MIGIGIDSVDVGRLAAMLARRDTLLDRLWTASERAHASTLANPVPTLAGRFAVKEAVMKALGVGLGAFDWQDVETLRAPGGAPHLVLDGRAAALASAGGVGGWRVSITHTDSVASAVVAALS
ncbi:MAG: holo-ACP synthase [Actinomycetota bacterium]|nr:holo-ACP synthase [Actinomycetota bacterium]